MDNEKLTTRKGFFQKAGLALAGTFMLGSVKAHHTRCWRC